MNNEAGKRSEGRKPWKANSKTPEKLLDAAIELFAANGYQGTSIRDIARLTEMTISNIYYHFGSKEGLLSAILERATNHIVEELSKVVRSDLAPVERFKLLLKTHFDLLLNIGRKEADILFLEEEHVSRFRKQFQLDLLDMYRKELQNLRSLGCVNHDNLTVVAFHIFGVINWHLRWYKPGGKMSLDEAADELVAFIFYGISGPPEHRRTFRTSPKNRHSKSLNRKT